MVRVFAVDSAGARLLSTATVLIGVKSASSNTILFTSGIQDYDQATDPLGRAVVDVTTAALGVPFDFEGAPPGNAQQFSASGTIGFGTGNIQPV